jgi:hypothetical protein
MLTKQKIKYLLALNLAWSIIGFGADYAWLSSIPLYLTPFTAICSLYPVLLSVWYFLKLKDLTPPNWLTFWIATGTLVYGILAQIYFPLLMSWKGINFHDVGSMFWVAVYGFQTVIMFRYLRPPKFFDIAFTVGFLALADYCHYFLKTFVDFISVGYPLWLENTTVILGISTQLLVILFFAIYRPASPEQQIQNTPVSVPEEVSE